MLGELKTKGPKGRMVVLGGGAVPDERGIPAGLGLLQGPRERRFLESEVTLYSVTKES